MPPMATSATRRTVSAGDPRLGSWQLFLVAHARLERILDEDLRAEHDLSLAEYDALLQLAQAQGRRLRMHQLADRVILSRSGVTRLIDRLVADGSVERIQCSTDARGAEAVLTEAGLGRLRSAAATHLRGVEEHFLGVVDEAELATMATAFERIVGAIETSRDETRRAG